MTSAQWVLIVASAGWVSFAYVGYPLLLWVLARMAPRPIDDRRATPPISVIIAVHDGAAEIEDKLRNTLEATYPERVEVLVASDHSTDSTESIVLGWPDERVRLVRNEGPRGKESAQAAAIAVATGEVLVFTDVSAQLSEDALLEIAAPFGDPKVGCVSSEDEVDSNGGEGAYVRYEMAIRRLESTCSSLIGVSGSFFAARRSLCDPWPRELASDFRTALEASRRGLRAVSAPGARARFRAVEDAAAEWPRKVRTVRRGIAVLLSYTDLLHPRHGAVALSLWGHKVARFTSPVALVVLLATSLAAAPGSTIASLLAAAQLVFYATGALALASPAIQSHLAPRLAAFFLLVNASMVVAWIYHLAGRRSVEWSPTRR